jgi:hypothetical protein
MTFKIENEPKCEVSSLFSVRCRCIGNLYAKISGLCNIDPIEANTITGNDLEPFYAPNH